jgi:hypothetical protein
VFQQQAMDEDIAAAYFLEKDAFCGIVEETGIIPRDVTVEIKDKAKGEVLDADSTLSSCSKG